MAELKLRNCPFCGGSVRFDKAYSYFRDSVIYCDDCDMVFTLDDCQASDDEICKAWNMRDDNADGQKKKHAHWIDLGGIYSCSHCGSEDGIETKYCSSCGFKMNGE